MSTSATTQPAVPAMSETPRGTGELWEEFVRLDLADFAERPLSPGFVLTTLIPFLASKKLPFMPHVKAFRQQASKRWKGRQDKAALLADARCVIALSQVYLVYAREQLTESRILSYLKCVNLLQRFNAHPDEIACAKLVLGIIKADKWNSRDREPHIALTCIVTDVCDRPNEIFPLLLKYHGCPPLPDAIFSLVSFVDWLPRAFSKLALWLEFDFYGALVVPSRSYAQLFSQYVADERHPAHRAKDCSAILNPVAYEAQTSLKLGHYFSYPLFFPTPLTSEAEAYGFAAEFEQRIAALSFAMDDLQDAIHHLDAAFELGNYVMEHPEEAPSIFSNFKLLYTNVLRQSAYARVDRHKEAAQAAEDFRQQRANLKLEDVPSSSLAPRFAHEIGLMSLRKCVQRRAWSQAIVEAERVLEWQKQDFHLPEHIFECKYLYSVALRAAESPAPTRHAISKGCAKNN